MYLLFTHIFQASSNLPYRQGILEAKSGNAVESLCVIFYPGLTSYPSEKENGVREGSYIFQFNEFYYSFLSITRYMSLY